MNTLNIENKEYVVISRKEYEDLRTKAAIKTVSSKKLSLADGKKETNNIPGNWSAAKSLSNFRICYLPGRILIFTSQTYIQRV